MLFGTSSYKTACTVVHQLLGAEKNTLSHILKISNYVIILFTSPNNEVHTIQRKMEKLEFKFLKYFNQKQNQDILLINGTIQKRNQHVYSVVAQDTKRTGNQLRRQTNQSSEEHSSTQQTK